jgi:hypothetical protein
LFILNYYINFRYHHFEFVKNSGSFVSYLIKHS